MRSAARFVLTTPLSSFRSLSLPSANYAVFIIAETSKQNVTFGHGSMAGATGFAFISEERGKEKSSKRTERGVWCARSVAMTEKSDL